MSAVIHSKRRAPGTRLVELIWFRALARGGKIPVPTIERVNAVRRLVALWAEEDVARDQ
jgi:hypothetical protein